MDDGWLGRRRAGDTVTLRDSRGSRRRLMITGRSGEHIRTEVWDTTYLESGLMLSCGADETTIGRLPEVEQFHLLRAGDRIWVTHGVNRRRHGGAEPKARPTLAARCQKSSPPYESVIGWRSMMAASRDAWKRSTRTHLRSGCIPSRPGREAASGEGHQSPRYSPGVTNIERS